MENVISMAVCNQCHERPGRHSVHYDINDEGDVINEEFACDFCWTEFQAGTVRCCDDPAHLVREQADGQLVVICLGCMDVYYILEQEAA